MLHRIHVLLVGLAAALGLAAVPPALATLTLTPVGINDGFTLSTFATIKPGNTGCCEGPFGVAISGSNVIASYGFGPPSNLAVFADSDGQTLASALFSLPGNGTLAAGMANAGGVAYGADPTHSFAFAQYKSDGTIDHDLTGVPQEANLGMASAPNGHIIATAGLGQLIDIDPLANGGLGSSRIITTSGLLLDGVAVSADGKTAYVATGPCVQAIDIASGTFGTCYLSSGGPDGIGVIRGGAFDGFIVANVNDGFNNGSIDLIDPLTNTFVTIANGGTRPDYASPDITSGTLLLDYSDVIVRLSCPGCSFSAPEPPSLGLLGLGLAGAALLWRRRGRFGDTTRLPHRYRNVSK
jgi:MYXO-CTERM domain-containing protein